VTITAATMAVTILLLTLAAIAGLSTTPARRAAPAAPERRYLAGRLDGVRIADIGDYEDSLLISFTARPGHGQLAGPFRVTGGQYAHARARRWHPPARLPQRRRRHRPRRPSPRRQGHLRASRHCDFEL
jgi:hypothetical protein